MKQSEVRVRFAPSPTGFLHIGGARTAIFNWIYTRSKDGKFLLRIEDTDKTRSSQEYLDSILGSLEWLGLDWDEDLYVQSAHVEYHRDVVMRLLESKKAYKCFCTAEMLAEKRKRAEKVKGSYLYDRTCRYLTPGECAREENSGKPFAIRCAVPEGKTVFRDLIHGETTVSNSEIEDFVILRQDSTPTYMLAVVADDHMMNISHVIRGDDHISNTPKQIILYRSLGWSIPEFGHMPLILGQDKTRLSKRHGAVSVDAYRERGYLPEALFNYLSLLGWSPGDDRELMTRDEIVQRFQIEDSQKKSAVFDEQKLNWINGQYISGMEDRKLAERIKPVLQVDPELNRLVRERGDTYLKNVLNVSKHRLKVLQDFLIYCAYYYRDPATYDPDAVKKYWKGEELTGRLAGVRLAVKDCSDYSLEGIESAVRERADLTGISAAKLIHPTRLAITGFGVSPGLFEVMKMLGKDTVIRRLEKAIRFLEGAN
ncbi:glutamate--tRNA ligase [candidate division KSB1 bacterium]